jgi:hypothetical protein
MDFEEWYEKSIGCNGKIDFEDTVEKKLYIMNIDDNYCLVKYHIGIYMTIVFNISTEQRLNRRTYYKKEYQCYHYKPAKERIQEQMETRAHKMILCNILGDPTFTW